MKLTLDLSPEALVENARRTRGDENPISKEDLEKSVYVMLDEIKRDLHRGLQPIEDYPWHSIFKIGTMVLGDLYDPMRTELTSYGNKIVGYYIAGDDEQLTLITVTGDTITFIVD